MESPRCSRRRRRSPSQPSSSPARHWTVPGPGTPKPRRRRRRPSRRLCRASRRPSRGSRSISSRRTATPSSPPSTRAALSSVAPTARGRCTWATSHAVPGQHRPPGRLRGLQRAHLLRRQGRLRGVQVRQCQVRRQGHRLRHQGGRRGRRELQRGRRGLREGQGRPHGRRLARGADLRLRSAARPVGEPLPGGTP
jgi:hypothetical protein